MRWQSDPAGNAVEAKGLVFVSDDGAPFRLLGTTDLRGESVAEVAFEAGRITYEMTYLRPRDNRADPTGRRRYEIPLRPDGIGPVAIQRTGFGEIGKAVPDDAVAVVRRVYESGENENRVFGVSGNKANPVRRPCCRRA